MVLQNYQNFIELTSNMIYIVALGVGLNCPRIIHLNTQCPPTWDSPASSTWVTPKWWKKCSTGQRFILKKVTSYKIHTVASWSLKSSQTSLWTILVETGSIQSVPCLLPYWGAIVTSEPPIILSSKAISHAKTLSLPLCWIKSTASHQALETMLKSGPPSEKRVQSNYYSNHR